MKKITLLALFIGITLNAQVRDENDIELSVSLGLASSNYYGDISLQNNESIYSPTFGIRADFYANNRWSFLLGLEYRTFGTKTLGQYYANNNFHNVSIKEKLNYIHIPFNANWHFGSNRNWNLNFGPALSFLQNTSVNGEKLSTTGLMKTQVGFGFGIGYRFKISEQISIAIEHQEYISFTSNIAYNKYTPHIGNYGGSFDVRFIYNFTSNKQAED